MSLRGKKVLITCGPTWVAVDDMRVLSNRSTGELGHLLGQKLSAAHAKVVMLQGPVTHPFRSTKIRVADFCFFDELAALLDKELKDRFDCVIHAAAVSDFKPKKKFTGKVSSGRKLRLELVPTPKIINRIKQKQPKTLLVGFKLESHFSDASALKETKELFSKGKCDLVVANFMKAGGYEALILGAGQSLLGKAKSKNQLANILVSLLRDTL